MNSSSEKAMSSLLSLLNETVNGFSDSMDSSTMRPLFCISNDKLKLLELVSYFSNYQLLNGCRVLLLELCRENHLTVVETPELEDINFLFYLNDKRIGVHVSHNPQFMLRLNKHIEQQIDEILNVVLQESTDKTPTFNKPNHSKYKDYPYKHLIRHITVKQFYEEIGSPNYEEFYYFTKRYNFEAEQALGLTVSAIPTSKTLEKQKVKVAEYLHSYFFETELKKVLTDVEIVDLKRWFEKYNEVLLSNASFAKSFISSEWFYNLQVVSECGLEYTAIVAGYLKSVEQLLHEILLALSDKYDFTFPPTAKAKDTLGDTRVPLSRKNKDMLRTMAGNLLFVIEKRKRVVFHKRVAKSTTNKALDFLNKYVAETRNAYLHKDNIYTWAEIQEIRTKTYCAYFLILSTFRIDTDKLIQTDN